MMTNQTPLFTVFTLAYRRLGLLQEALEAIRRQTYKNLEIIVVSNGATAEIGEYLSTLKGLDNRIKIIHFSENQSPDDDPGKIFRVCWNAALKEATGDYIWYQSDDDLIADDYVEKMVALFLENPDCTTAAGLPMRIDLKGDIINEGQRMSNYRPRYMPGHLLALSTIGPEEEPLPNGMMFSSSGVIFAIKRDVLIKAGGYHPSIENSQLYGIVPFGVTGFDETAILYFRKHEGQSGIYLNTVGQTALVDTISLIKDWQLQERWGIFGKDTAQCVVDKILNNACKDAIVWFVINLYYFRLKACARLLKNIWYRSCFWKMLPARLWVDKRQFWYYLKPKIRRIFESNPWLVQKISFLAPLEKRVYR